MADNWIPLAGPEGDEILAAVGWALTEWSKVEMALSLLFSSLSEIPTYEKASVVMDTVVAFPTRLAICSALMNHESNKRAEQAIWQKLADKLTKLYKLRHTIAHFTLIGEKISGGKSRLVVSPFMSFDRLRRGDYKTKDKAEIEALKIRFSEAHDAVLWVNREFLRTAPNAKPALPDDPEPQLVAHIRAVSAQNSQ